MFMSQVLRAIVTTLKEIGAKNTLTDGDIQSAKYVATCFCWDRLL